MKMVYNEQLNDYICKAQPIEWAVVNVQANDDYTIDITFINGEKRVFDASKLLNKKIYEPLRRQDFFLKAHVGGDTVVWNDDIDIAPEYLYNNSTPITYAHQDEIDAIRRGEEEYKKGEIYSHKDVWG